MPKLPAIGARVSLRYRLPAGSVPPRSDVIGHLLAVSPHVRVQTKTGAVLEIMPDDVLAVRELSAAPVRTSQIRATEYAAAMAWPGTEQRWLDGWLLRAAEGHTHRSNSAVPLEVRANLGVLPSIIDWYSSRGLRPWLAVPDRLLRSRTSEVPPHLETLVMVRDLPADEPDATVKLAARPDERWLRLYRRDIPEDVLTAVVDGDVVFATRGDAGVGRAAVTNAPDGARWVGVSAVRVVEDHRRRGHARSVCSALLAWGAEHDATRAYVQVLVNNADAIALYESMGFATQHRARYVDATMLSGHRL